jgi:hypothetical protein
MTFIKLAVCLLWLAPNLLIVQDVPSHEMQPEHSRATIGDRQLTTKLHPPL